MNVDIELIKQTYVYFVMHKDNSSLSLNIKNNCKKHIKRYIKRDILKIIEDVISNYYNIPIPLLQSKTRKREIVQARQTEMYFAKSITNLSYAKIGMRYGMKDHSTALHAYKTINNLIDTNSIVRNDCKIIKNRL